MSKFSVLVEVRPRQSLNNPEGETLERALAGLGYDKFKNVRVGRTVRFSLEAPDEPTARARIAELCQRVLVNPATEDADFEFHLE